MKSPQQQLLLVKYLYQKGEDALSEHSVFSAGLAVSLFQDAVESLTWTIAKEVDADIRERDGFEAYWDAVKSAKRNTGQKELPPRAKMRDLNKARVNFKHYGLVPADSEAARLQIYTEEFLTEACREFFKIDFKSLSAVELINDPDVVSHLQLAQSALAKNNAVQALEECALAYSYVNDIVNVLLPPLPFNWEDMLAGQPLNTVPRLKDVEETLATVRNFALATSLRIPLDKFIRFRKLIPHVIEYDGMKQINPFDKSEKTPAINDIVFCYNYIINLTLSLERTLGPEIWTFGKSPLR